MNSTTTLTKTSTKSSRSLSTGPIILTLDNDIGHHEHENLDLLTPPSPTRPRVRALRRKKHLSIYRASAPAQSPVAEVAIEIPFAPRPQSMVSPPSVIEECPPAYPPTKPQAHNRSQSQPNVRLGHPSRPYYSAIRKNMSRPNSPFGDSSMNSSRPTSMVYPSRTTSPTFGYLPRTFEDSDDDETPSVSRAASPSPFISGLGGSSAAHSGFSVSGEMEMRMALAGLTIGQQEPSFRFQRTGKIQSSVHGRVKKLGKGLKDLVRGSHA
ncbi:hypothetical protein B0H12DRAFT_38816 [Mycena haematopus]|nr:hypothetical protein B0H12DRAFT_38816 [Mycena haematopus]